MVSLYIEREEVQSVWCAHGAAQSVWCAHGAVQSVWCAHGAVQSVWCAHGAVQSVWCVHVPLPGYMGETVEFLLSHMNWFSAMSNVGKCSLTVSVSLRLGRQSVVVRCALFAVVNAR